MFRKASEYSRLVFVVSFNKRNEVSRRDGSSQGLIGKREANQEDKREAKRK